MQGFTVIWMMVGIGLYAAIRAYQRLGGGQFAVSNGVGYGVSGFVPVGMPVSVRLADALNGLTVIALVVCFATSLTLIPQTVFSALRTAKISNWKNLLATGTAFCKNWFRHSFTPTKVMLGPLAGLSPASGLNSGANSKYQHIFQEKVK